MQDSDKELIEQANALDLDDWQGVARLIEKADDEATRHELRRIARWKYHNEEYSTDNY